MSIGRYKETAKFLSWTEIEKPLVMEEINVSRKENTPFLSISHVNVGYYC